MRTLTVREHARLTTATVSPSLDLATVSERDFDWLLAISAKTSRGGARLVQCEGRRTLSLDNYVGVFETPSGVQIEVLPKHAGLGDDRAKLRALLIKMINTALLPSSRSVSEASLQITRHPLTEWLARRYLDELDRLLKRGIRFNYERVEEESRYLRGQLDLPRQLRQPPERQHRFHIRHDVFSPNRPENRLLRSALQVVSESVLSADSRRLANTLRTALHEIPPSPDVARDFEAWSATRLMAHYEPIRPLCELILAGTLPFTQAGDWRGLSLLFPMEKLFERYVAAQLRARLASGVHLTIQARSHHLCTHQGKPWFRLEPDLVLSLNDYRAVLDTKWKLIDTRANNAILKYGMSQEDFYQLFAYGQRYLSGAGDLFLIYPAWAGFTQPLPPFHFSTDLRVWAVPYDLDSDSFAPSPLTHCFTPLSQTNSGQLPVHTWATSA